MKHLLLLGILVSFSLPGIAAAADAESRLPAFGQVHGSKPMDVYAFSGKTCPPGSHLYMGPEQTEIEKTGNIYCTFDRRYVWFTKTKDLTKCPDGKPFVKPAEEFENRVWCDMPDADFAAGGALYKVDKETVLPPPLKTEPGHVIVVPAPVDPAKMDAELKKSLPPTAVAPPVVASIGTNHPAALPPALPPVTVGTNAP